jgi:hypothetical protein
MSKLEFKMDLPSDAELERQWNMVPKLERYGVGDKTTRAAGKIVLDRVKQLTPRSSQTGSAKKRSKTQRSAADWAPPLWKGMSMAVRKYATSTWAWVGPRWRDGQKIYFIAEWKKQTRRAFYWGRPGPVVRKLRNWIVQAFDETKGQQLDAMKESIKSTVDQVMRAN